MIAHGHQHGFLPDFPTAFVSELRKRGFDRVLIAAEKHVKKLMQELGLAITGLAGVKVNDAGVQVNERHQHTNLCVALSPSLLCVCVCVCVCVCCVCCVCVCRVCVVLCVCVCVCVCVCALCVCDTKALK